MEFENDVRTIAEAGMRRARDGWSDYKVLITTVVSSINSGAAVHTQVVSFENREDAKIAIDTINQVGNCSRLYLQTAVALY